MIYDVIIIGASISGNYLASLISKKGYKVLVIEEDFEIGHPSKCTGLVSWRIFDYLPNLDKKIIQNVVSRAEFIYGDKSFILRSKNPVYVLNRILLDKFVHEEASNSGAEFKIGEKFLNAENLNDKIKVFTNKGKYECKVLVGADGANSSVAKNFNLYRNSELFVGVQGTVNGNFEKDKVELWFGDKIAKEFFAWVVPINENLAKVGLATKKNPSIYYKNFLKKRVGKFVKPDTAGIIKIGLCKKSVLNRVILVGDAAMQIKPFSGGGIIYSLISSKIASLALLKALKYDNFSEKFLFENYEKVWKEKFKNSIIKGILMRRLFSKEILLKFWFTILPHFKNYLEKIDMDFY